MTSAVANYSYLHARASVLGERLLSAQQLDTLIEGNEEQKAAVLQYAGVENVELKSIEDSIKTVKKNRVTPILAHYSPIPHTALWNDAVAASRYDLESDPIYTNNAILPCQDERFSWQTMSHLKNLVAA